MTLDRRQLLAGTAALALSHPLRALGAFRQAPLGSFEGDAVLDHILAKAKGENWTDLPIGERIGKVAIELLGTPYVGHTIELDNTLEFCVVNLHGLDCVTLFEDSLDIARILRKPKPDKAALIAEVRLTRYRGGVQGDFTTRLHYTKEWIADNVKKGVVEDLTPILPGAKPFTQQVGYMSEHPEAYRQLKAHSELVPAIRKMEESVNAIQTSYLPLDRIAAAEHLLQTGDIVGVTTTQTGIDIAHTGLCYKDQSGVAHFLDASSSARKMKVTLETRLSEAVRWSEKLTGVVIARPLEVAI